jgi:hypothetical protein
MQREKRKVLQKLDFLRQAQQKIVRQISTTKKKAQMKQNIRHRFG